MVAMLLALVDVPDTVPANAPNIVPPTLKSPPMPTPPVTTNAPVAVDEATVVFDIVAVLLISSVVPFDLRKSLGLIYKLVDSITVQVVVVGGIYKI